MKIFDLILYNGEEIIDLRFKLLNSRVDYFIVNEFDQTFQGFKKKYTFDKKKFKKYGDKIIYCERKMPLNQHFKDAWERETYQRNHLMNGVECKNDDIIILSDVDELIDPSKISLNLNNISLYECLSFRFYGNYINLTNPFWLHPISTSGKNIKMLTLQKLRMSHKALKKGKEYDIYRKNINNLNVKKINLSGWHFSSLKKKNVDLFEMIIEKHKSYSHVEFNNKNFNSKNRIKFKIHNSLDLYNAPYLWGTLKNVISNKIIKEWMEERKLFVHINKFNINANFKNKSSFSNIIRLKINNLINKIVNFFIK